MSPASYTHPNSHDRLYLQTLGRGINLLSLLSKRPLNIKSIEDSLNINRSAVYRLVRTLEMHSLVERDADTGLVRLTPLLWQIGSSALGPGVLRETLSRAARRLRDEFGETVHVAVYATGGKVIYIDKADGLFPIGSYTELGGEAPAHAVATGKALLAWTHNYELRTILSADAQPLQTFTETTITNKGELTTELKTIRRQGYAENRGEWRADVGGFAIPVFEKPGIPFAALGFSGPIERIYTRKKQLLQALSHTRVGLINDPDKS